MSIWTEFGPMLEKLLGRKIPVARGDWRPGDQKVFVADIRKAGSELGWTPQDWRGRRGEEAVRLGEHQPRFIRLGIFRKGESDVKYTILRCYFTDGRVLRG